MRLCCLLENQAIPIFKHGSYNAAWGRLAKAGQPAPAISHGGGNAAVRPQGVAAGFPKGRAGGAAHAKI